MALLTSFRATGRCSNCGTEGEIWIQSHLGSDGATYRVGDDVSTDINLAVIRKASFVVREPHEHEAIHVLSAWSCDACDFEGFAEIVFANGRVADIRPVELTVDVLDRLNFVEEAIDYKIELYTNRSMWDEWGVWPSWVRALREKLAAEERNTIEDTSAEYYPKGATVGGGKYRLEEHYLGLGDDQLWFARTDGEPTIRYLVSISPDNGLNLTNDSPALLRPADGLFVPRFLGQLDVIASCAYVEQLPSGTPLRTVCGELSSHALDLGAQVGELLGRAHTSGVLDVGIRPEYVWAVLEGNRLVVTGIGGRNRIFFGAARRRRDLVTARLFTHEYIAPEVYRGDAYDDRALTLTLAVMVAEWLIGRYPYAEGDGAWGYNRLWEGEHLEIPGAPPLVELLKSALRPDPAQRPSLPTFTQALRALSTK